MPHLVVVGHICTGQMALGICENVIKYLSKPYRIRERLHDLLSITCFLHAELHLNYIVENTLTSLKMISR